MVDIISNQAGLPQARSGKLCWLHLSDIHFWRKNDWRDDAARRKLIGFLQKSLNDGTLPRPDLVFCTGDIAMGETAPKELAVQYESARGFFDQVLEVYGLPITRLFVVPGNHDVNRSVVSRNAQKGLRQATLEEIKKDWAGQTVEYWDAIKRLDEYGEFVKKYLPHQFDEHARHCYAKVVNVNGVRIGIGGFNSAWTCYDNDDKSQLWLAGEWQFNAADAAFAGKTDLCIGLMHHPASWFTAAEESLVKKRVRAGFQFWLHGHEHDAWVVPTDREIVICAGAVNAHSDDEFGINLVQLDLAAGSGNVYLFAYKTAGNAWLICPSEDAPMAVRPIKFAPIVPSGPLETAVPVPPASDPAPQEGRAGNAGSVLEKLEARVEKALTDPAAQAFKKALCSGLGLAPNVSLAQMLQKLDALQPMASQMFMLQKSLVGVTFPAASGEDTHPIEVAAVALYLRAAILPVDRAAIAAQCTRCTGLSIVPENSRVLIAVLAAVLGGEIHHLRMREEKDEQGKIKRMRAASDGFIAGDDLAFDPFRDRQAALVEVAKRVDKLYVAQEVPDTPEQQAALCEEIRLAVAQQREVFSTYYRFIVSQGKEQWLHNDANCAELYALLDIPVTRILPGTQIDVKALLGVSAVAIDKLFQQLFEILKSAQQASNNPTRNF